MNAEYLAMARTLIAQRRLGWEHGRIDYIGKKAADWMLQSFELFPTDPWDDLIDRLEALIQAMDDANAGDGK